MNAKQRLCLLLWHLFWRTLCPTPDQSRLHAWWYHHSGNIARFFYRKAYNLRG